MDYELFDSSGTDDDLPPSHQNRIPRGVRVAGNVRAAAVGSVPYPRLHGETDMETQIHHLEIEAYTSVLRAFKAQADVISWSNESLITELRNEFKLSNEEHRELLTRVNADDVIQRIREWRRGGGVQPGMLSTSQAVHDPVPSPAVSASRKKQKISQSRPSQSFGGTSPFHPQRVAASNQPSLAAAKRGSIVGAKSKKHKSGQVMPGESSMKMQYPSSGPSGRGHLGNRVSSGGLANEPAEAPSFNSVIGRKVRTRWPADNIFYEAVVTDYNPAEGQHALTYDMGTALESVEWVTLSEISGEDLQWEGEDPGISRQGGGGYGGSGRGMNRSVGRSNNGPPGVGRGRGGGRGGSAKVVQSRRGTQNGGIGKKVPDDDDDVEVVDIQILHTDALIKEVERVFGASYADTCEIEKAKKVLKKHEEALADAIARLADISDSESDEGGGHFLHGQGMDCKS